MSWKKHFNHRSFATNSVETKDRRLLAIFLVGASGVVVSLLLFSTLKWAEFRVIYEEFTNRASDRMLSVESAFDSGQSVVRSVAAHIQASSEINQQHFRVFAKHQLSQDASLHALSWNKRIRPSELRQHVEVSRKWNPNYTVTKMNRDGHTVEVDYEHDDDRDLVVVDYIEPIAANQSAVGFDIASESTRLKALSLARDTGELAASGRIRLVQEQGDQYGMLVMSPIYQQRMQVESVEDRRKFLEGIVVGVYRIGTAVEAAMSKLESSRINVYLFDESTPSAPTLLHAHLSDKSTSIESLADLRKQPYFQSSSFEMAARNWTVCCIPTSDYIAAHQTWLPAIVLQAGLAATLGLVVYLVHLARLTDRLKRQIAARVAAEQSLTIAQHSIDNSHIPIYWVGPDGRFRFINRSAAATLGYEIDELYGLGMESIDPAWKPDKWLSQWEQLKATGSAIFESKHRRKDGEQFQVEIMVNYLAFSDQEYLFCLVMDITERKQQQEKIREHERILADVSRLMTLGEMVAGIAHEINQPLSAISNYSAACMHVISDSKYEFERPIEEWTRQIGQQALRCGDIIRTLRRFVKRNEAEWTRIDLRVAIADSILLVSEDAWKRSVRIDCAPQEASLIVNGNLIQLQQVLVNLLKNAYEAMSENDCVENSVLVSTSCSGDSVELVVEDHGPGIDAQHHERVFDAFFTTKTDSMGLGLAISRSIVEAHGGRLWFDSVACGGSSFHVELPCVQESLHA